MYFDNAATTAVREEVFSAMQPYFTEQYGNPSSIYGIARKSRKALDAARAQVAAAIGADLREIYFTAGGTEADNWALRGIAEAHGGKGRHIITTAIEHHAIIHTCQYLEKQGYEISYLPVDRYGIVSIDDVEAAIRSDTILISVMAANNEVGTIQPIEEIGKLAHERQILFHTDAVQALGHIELDVKQMNIDLLSVSSHKIYGPKGVGALYIKKGVECAPLLHGGAQERNARAGTENVAGIVGFGKAAELAIADFEEENAHMWALRDRLIAGILNEIPHSTLNGHPEHRLAGNVNVSLGYIEGESALMMLDMEGICASSGSACASGSHDPSHVLTALGLDKHAANSALRFSLGRYNTAEEVDSLIASLAKITMQLRNMSAAYQELNS